MEQTPPGWYPHADGGLHYWNGQQWAEPPPVTLPTISTTSAQGPPTARPETPWTPSAPRPQEEPSGKPPLKGRRRGRTVALAIAGLLVASFVATEVAAFREDAAPPLQPVASVANPADGCQRFLSLSTGLLREQLSDTEADGRLAQLRDAARENDPLLASDLQDMLNGENAADVSAAGQIVMRRCGAAGYISQDNVDRLRAAATSAIGAATTPPTRPPVAAPPLAPAPAEPETDVAAGVAAAREACEMYAHMFSVDVPIEDSDDVFQEAADASSRAALADFAAWEPLRDAMHSGVQHYTSTAYDGDAVISSFEEIGRLCDGFIGPPS